MGRSIKHVLVCGVALLLLASPAAAGTISLAWDAVPGATGYRVYYGTASGQYTSSITSATASATVSGLQDCAAYFVAVKAYNGAGESPQFSNELTGWSRPVVTSATPATAVQGDQIVMDIVGSNFQSGALVDLGNPHVVLSSVTVLSCTHVQLLATVEPTAQNVRPAQVGKLDVTVANPGDVFGMRSQGFEVLINPARFDVNRSDAATTDRIDGKDTIYLSRHFGLSEADPNYDPDHDFDGDGWVDGADLAFIASNLGRCWATSTKTWAASACPANLQ
jgi:hypothetical protein